ncbi:bifunctional tRNA (5-methylaminomethyl-2-thiouridine)(34)-methyltransferase MnmD/FAD-dependent 5-carboxymethylaminomethyl-2-thiouridine(34) oxidoreductase MnmC [Halopseudomonas nanhaiensis]|uniref:bifunctional tRNA (5-methylaminomethyl-2-thiouridine)(34)-methyltransferase MnmD/FAD-dependent 5-carboxymethylaminomethyl-2-thiouridine(34) oxidoreductase MnmC n=1 Tax=Halopseudomonas nanhaiensis TaxID=2830842 RepID=UPI001CBB3B6D|nr:bifunctional tRNA (5-methylaminomethyl-2-thiouridine)(34)-methyltransferase MnmD/FAD-dependent 5-carboxymethylaminomethyl-2-thiouridine(34) oxidoreductase MnmC [Halopseudomonas nanhaiensis]UAW97384.1 bifunctional tRNA (5-methylaminomethyl-2-thiouridine)(34)-methyltransferase MnmD/FAD-dependent 5-carboxymethylaminomethyl-2-thiouridine(34) oxidoreductase MnmC [Halopseudomonas nanhaiensis]
MTSSPPQADLTWTDDGQPFSAAFGDVYFSRESGLEETRHVFLHHNRLHERWAALGPGDAFCIAETGFGTGLNFLCAWQLWDQSAAEGCRLHFVSTEKFPLALQDLQRALALWPELRHWSEQLLAQYEDMASGWQRFCFDGGRVTLTLLIGDLLDTLPQLDAAVDAWFLDGFAPAKNPQMWQPQLYQLMAGLSAPGATVATFTSVGEVRRGLQAAGFAMQKVKGYGRKREMLAGQLEQVDESTWSPPWYARPLRPSGERSALVIGAGLAGCSTAFALAQRGWTVSVIERHAGEAQEASGNPQGILYCKLSAHPTPLSRFVQTSYAYCLRLLRERLRQGESGWDPCGILQLAADEKEETRLRAIAANGYPASFLRWVDSAQASELAGIRVDRNGLHFPGGGWVHPPALCRALLDHPNISLLTCHEAMRLDQQSDRWTATSASAAPIASASVVVVCAAADSRHFQQTAHLPLKAIRGQITHLPATEASRSLRSVLCAEGYVSPARGGEHHVGASFRFDRLDCDPSVEESRSNLELLPSLSAAFADAVEAHSLDPASLQARAALRCTTPDYLPVIGPVVDPEAFNQHYAILRKDAARRIDTPAAWLDGLYVNAAHGSRGLLSAPLSGELIAAWLDGEPLPLPRPVSEAVHPSRFLLRELIRGGKRN